MAFSDAFARGYAIGDAAKKRRAVSSFFAKFNELTKEADVPDTTEIGGIPVPSGATSEAPAIPVAKAADAGAASPLLNDQAIPAPQVSAPQAIPLKQASEVRKSLTQGDIKDLDKLAMEAARASGDIEVYTALQRTTDSFLQSKVLGNLSNAQVAAQNGDTKAVEKYLTAAYRYVPDGQEIKFHKGKDGQLMVKDPWEDGKEIPMTAEMIGNIGTMLMNPQKWSELVRQERKDRGAAALENRKVAVAEGGLKIDQARVDLLGQQIGLQGEELKLKQNQDKLATLMAPIERLNKYQQAIYYGALADEAKMNAANGGKSGNLLDEANAISKSIDEAMAKYTQPERNQLGEQVDPNWKPPADIMVGGPNGQRPLAANELRDVSGYAQTIALANRGAIGNQLAISAALQLVKATIDPQNFNATIDAKSGTMYVPFHGKNVPVQLPPQIIQGLAGQQGGGNAAPQGSPFWGASQFSPGG